MRTLQFIVSGQEIRLDPSCDVSKLNPGSTDQVQAIFTFSKEWTSTPKVAAFYSRLGNEYPPQILKDGKSCMIPIEALHKRVFKVQILGKNGLATDRLEIDQKGGCV